MLVSEATRAFNHGAPGIQVEFSIDQDGVLTIDRWGGAGNPPSVAQVETWLTEASAVDNTTGANETTLRDQLIAALPQIDQQLAILNGAPTAADQRAALIFTLRAVKRLVRLQVRALDSVS